VIPTVSNRHAALIKSYHPMKSALLFPFLCSLVIFPTVRAADASGSPAALYRAVSAGDLAAADRELAAKADPNTLYKDGLTLLYYAVAAG